MTSERAITAQRRFGYGVVPDAPARVVRDPLGYAIGQLNDYEYKDRSGLESSSALLTRFKVMQRSRRESDSADAFKAAGALVKGQMQQETGYRFKTAVQSGKPLVERLVSFWSDHFCVSCVKGPQVRLIAGAYEREAIRPHVTGRFRDMLGAVMHHPAMLIYLDNTSSVGPDSPKGRKFNQGLNENLGRELLELHTVGVDAGYSQTDVTEAARIITGWTYNSSPGDETGHFLFDARSHQPGQFTVMGVVFDQNGEAQGDALLDMLAAHPSTARHIAGKLVHYFVGDNAAPALTDAVAQRFSETDGDLKETMIALLQRAESWDAPAAKVLPPFDMLVAFSRLIGVKLKNEEVIAMSRSLGQPLWEPRSPAGFPKGDDDWATSGAMVGRLKLAMNMARQSDLQDDPMGLANAALGRNVTQPLEDAISRAATRPEATAMLLLSPQIQLR
ncbi:DUF1800 family protein [Rhizobium sp. L1K21]|uniref:DUF1800 domain-containing protein n=1 Tax=Rhizobium sp. L1K21 TaxID=2954933 RepID=UPI0020933BAB|nr:DUF1800 domain-containing protein [Rhizobium sp. L1K21]